MNPSLNAAEAGYEVLYDIVENCRRYDTTLNELGLPPNGDDYNAVFEMLGGSPYRAPHTEGR